MGPGELMARYERGDPIRIRAAHATVHGEKKDLHMGQFTFWTDYPPIGHRERFGLWMAVQSITKEGIHCEFINWDVEKFGPRPQKICLQAAHLVA